ncbi:MAG: hypothetical protein SGI86_06360 [Deltaproteobacteria bacterium]|nr:hypothetical protein [Deltaproteobacteria bacterium]
MTLAIEINREDVARQFSVSAERFVFLPKSFRSLDRETRLLFWRQNPTFDTVIGSIRQGDIGTVRGKVWGEEQYDVALTDGTQVRVPGADLAAIEKRESLHEPDAECCDAPSLGSV